jgi:hypothetical protein
MESFITGSGFGIGQNIPWLPKELAGANVYPSGMG